MAAFVILAPIEGGAAELYSPFTKARIAIFQDCNFKAAREEIPKVKDKFRRGPIELSYKSIFEQAARTRREYKLAREANIKGNDFYRRRELDKAARQYRFAKAKFESLLDQNNPAAAPCTRYKRVIAKAVKIVGRNLGLAATGHAPPKKLLKRLFDDPRYQGFRISTDGTGFAATEFCKKKGYARHLRYGTETVQDRAYNMVKGGIHFSWEGQPVEVFKFIECNL